MKKYYSSRREAISVRDQRNERCNVNHVYKMKFGRHKGMFFVGSYIEYLNYTS